MLCFTISIFYIVLSYLILKMFKPRWLVIIKKVATFYFLKLPFIPKKVENPKKNERVWTIWDLEFDDIKFFFKNILRLVTGWKNKKKMTIIDAISYLYNTDFLTLFLNTKKVDSNFIRNGHLFWYDETYYRFCINYRDRCIEFWDRPESEFHWRIFCKAKFLFDRRYYELWKNINFKMSLIFHGKSFIYIENIFYYYYSVFYKKIRRIVLPLIISLIFFIYMCNYFYINLLHQLSIWLISGFLFFWLVSGFNFFLKRYKYGKFTSIITRFWKRTNIYFWLVEGFLFSLFIYYFLNSSQEPLYMYDFSSLNQTYLVNLYGFYNSNITLIIFILISTVLMLFTVNFISTQGLIFILVLTIIFFYIFLLESYQFYYILTLFYEVSWEFYHELNSWVLETESPIMRTKNQYNTLALIAKYWHFLFIFVGWVFFVVKVFEQKRNHFTLFGYNIQNAIILFWLNLLFIIQWLKWINRRFFDSIYYWFFTDTNMQLISLLINEL